MYALAIPIGLLLMIVAGTVGADTILHLYQFFDSQPADDAKASWHLRMIVVACAALIMLPAALFIYRYLATRGIPFR